MVINNLNARGARCARYPLKANPPLIVNAKIVNAKIVNANAVLSFSVSLQHLKPVARQDGEIS
jgi:hypothetical protein